jgi:hypothetical protein
MLGLKFSSSAITAVAIGTKNLNCVLYVLKARNK